MKKQSEHSGGVKWFICGAAAALLAAALLYFVFMVIPAGGSPAKPDTVQTIRKAKEIERLIGKHYLGEINEKTQTDMMFVGQVAGLGDQYSRYYTKEAYEELRNRRQGEYTGIGINFMQRAEDGAMVVVSVSEGSPAEKAGLKPDDIMLQVAGQDTAGMTTSDLISLIQENTGKEIEIAVRRGQEETPVILHVTPGSVETITVTGKMLDDKKTGLITISQFARITVEQYQKTYKELQDQGMKQMILDLRGNGGGLVESACDIAKMLLPEGTIVYEEDKNGNKKYHNNDQASGFTLPLAVLVDEGTASAAEILTGAIQDYETGTIVGTQTFGKGIVQNIYRLSDGSVIQLTVTHYYTPKGNDIHEKGITPDIKIPTAEEPPKTAAEDPQLQAALKTLSPH